MVNEALPQTESVEEASPQPEKPQKKLEGFFDELFVSYKGLTLYKGDRLDALLTPSQVPCTDVLEDVWFLEACPQCTRKHLMPTYLVYLEKFNTWSVKPLVRIGQELFVILKPILGPLFVAGRSMTAEATKEMMQKKKEMERQASGIPQSPLDFQMEQNKAKAAEQKKNVPQT